MVEKCICGHEKKDHLNNESVCLKPCECLIFRIRATGLPPEGETDG